MPIPDIGFVTVGFALMILGAAIYNYFGEYPVIRYIAPIAGFFFAGVGAYIIGTTLAPTYTNFILIIDSLAVIAGIGGWILYNIFSEATRGE